MVSAKTIMESMYVVNFHYLVNNISTDWITNEDDPVIEELLSKGFNFFKNESENGLIIFLQNPMDVYLVSKITDYPHFLYLNK